GRDHPLSATVELHHSRLRACDVEGPRREERRQGAGAGAGGVRLHAVRGCGLMNVALAKTDTGRAVDRVFAAARDRLPGAGKVADARWKALEAFERAGLPHRRIEEWKYTDLRALMREVLPLADAPDVAAIERARAALKACAIDGAAK